MLPGQENLLVNLTSAIGRASPAYLLRESPLKYFFNEYICSRYDTDLFELTNVCRLFRLKTARVHL